MKVIPDLETVRKLFTYNDGKLFWKTKTSKYSNAVIGSEAGSLYTNGYMIVKISGVRYMLHHIIYFYHTGTYELMLDHKDCNPLNNRIENLRPCTVRENSYNRKISKRNKSGKKGVYFSKSTGKYVAQCTSNGKMKNLGYFNNIDDASDAYKRYAEINHGEYVNYG